MERMLGQLDEHLAVVEALRPLLPRVEEIVTRLLAALRAGGKVLWMGNGGSAADSLHLAAELVGRFERERPGWASIALCENAATLTSVANDYGHERIFARQVEALARPEDVLIGISTSGRSENILLAMKVAERIGATRIGLAGRDGGALVAATDLCLVVPSERTSRIQEAHILIGHLLCDAVETALTAEAAAGQR